MDLINKGLYGVFFACEVWCIADVSSVSPSLEQSHLSILSNKKCFNDSFLIKFVACAVLFF